jgi:hypothetical protein
MGKKAIIIFDFDTKTAVKNIQEAQKEIGTLQAAQKKLQDEEKALLKSQQDLEKQGKKNSDEWKANADRLQQIKNLKMSEEYLKQSSDIRNLKKEVRENNKVLDQNTKFLNANEGSIEQMRLALSDATKRWNEMSAAERQNTEQGQNLQKHIKGLSDNLKELESSVGDNRRNVGNYTSALEGLPGPIGNATKSFSGLNKQLLHLLKHPIVALIAAIVAALYGLFKAFQSTDSGATKFNAIMEQVSSIIDVVRQRAIQLIGALDKLLSGDFTGAANEFKTAITGIGVAFKDATKAANDYIYELDRIEDAENNYISRRADIRRRIAELEYTAADRGKSTSERRKALEEAIELSKEESVQMKKLAEDRLNAELEDLAGKSNGRDKVTEKEILAFVRMSDEEQMNAKKSLQVLRDNYEGKFTELENFYAKMVDADTKFFEENKKNNAKITAFDKEIAEQRLSKLEAEKKAFEERKKADADWVEQYKANREKEEKIEDEKKKIIEKFFEDQRVARLTDEQKRAENFDKQMQMLRDAGLSELEIMRLQNEEKNRMMEEQYLKEVADKEKTEAAKRALEDATFNAQMELAEGASMLLKAADGENKEFFEVTKAIDTSIAIIKGIMAVQNALATIPPPANVPAAIAIGLKTAANVLAIQKVKFAQGGNIEGNSHAQGGTIIEAEKGEVVINKYAAARHWQLLSDINTSTGGRPIYAPKFALGGNIDGGLVNREISGGVDSAINTQKQIAEAMRNIRIITKISDIEKVRGDVIGNKATADLR